MPQNNTPLGLLLTTPLNKRVALPDGFEQALISVDTLTTKLNALTSQPINTNKLNSLTVEFIAFILSGMPSYYDRQIKKGWLSQPPVYVLLDLPQYATPAFHNAFIDTGIGVAYYLHPKRFGRRRNYQLYLYQPHHE